MIKISKVNQYIICILFVFGISNLLFAGDQNTFLDYISKKIIKETKDENEQNVQMALRFSNVLGHKLNHIVDFNSIEKIFIPYKTDINSEQIFYLFQNAMFKQYEELPPCHLLPVGMFQLILKNYSVLDFHIYAGAPMISVTSGINEYWLEIPDYKNFYALGKEKKIT